MSKPIFFKKIRKLTNLSSTKAQVCHLLKHLQTALADDFLKNFWRKKNLGISCQTPPQMIHMKYQILFSTKNMDTITNLRSAGVVISILKVILDFFFGTKQCFSVL